MQPHDAIAQIIADEAVAAAGASAAAQADIKRQYTERLAEGRLTRDENPVTHFCSYFLPYRMNRAEAAGGTPQIFLEAHKKSGLWLAPGGHIDPGETPGEAAERELDEELNLRQPVGEAKLLTITHIVRDVRSCTVHYDIWHFVPLEDDCVLPTRKEGEFDDARWFTLDEARKAVSDESNLAAFEFLKKNLLV